MDLFGETNQQARSQMLVPLEGAVYDDRQCLDVRNILQPKTVTYARYHFSKLYNLMFVHIREELQEYISKNLENINCNELITIPLFTKHYPHFRGDASAMYHSVRRLMKDEGNFVSFEWQYDPDYHRELFRWMQRGVNAGARARLSEPAPGQKIQQFSALIVNVVRCENDPGKLIVSINPAVLPFLLYYGKGVGGTTFDRDVSLGLSSSYSFRIYELIMEWKREGVKKISLADFRDIVGYPDSYDIYDLKSRVLDVARNEIRDAGSCVNFEYDLEYDVVFGTVEGRRGRYPKNCVKFTITDDSAKKDVDQQEKIVLLLLREVADPEKLPLCEGLASKIYSEGRYNFFYAKFKYYNSQLKSGKISREQYRNTLLKIILEMTGVDLRSEYHIRNARLASRRKAAKPDNEPRLLFEEP